MKRVVHAITHIMKSIDQKTILEVACGSAEFSIYASRYAKRIYCIDIDSKRLLPMWKTIANMHFDIINAENMPFEANTFDTVIIYNAVGHIEYSLENILEECQRVLRHDGHIYIISSYKMDKMVIEEHLIPMLKKKTINFCSEIVPPFYYVKLGSAL